MKKAFLCGLTAAVLLAVLIACGGNTVASTIRLMKTEGTVSVSDDGGKEVEPRENLMIYSGYGMDTAPISYAWINLDEAKLTKMDEDSTIQIQKNGKDLEIQVDRGGLFFNVTQPLAEDETMCIRTSSMTVGIRGTCGWVEVPDMEHMNVYLLDGTVAVTAGDQEASVSAGEMAAMAADGSIEVREFSPADIPDFVWEELDEDSLPGPGAGQPEYDPADLDPMNAVSNAHFEYETSVVSLVWDEPVNVENIRSTGYVMYRIYLKEGNRWVTGLDSLDESWGIKSYPGVVTMNDYPFSGWLSLQAGNFHGIKIETLVTNPDPYKETVVGLYEDLDIRLDVNRIAAGPAASVTFTEDGSYPDMYTLRFSGLTPNAPHSIIFRLDDDRGMGYGGAGKEDGTDEQTTGGNGGRATIEGTDYRLIEYIDITVSEGGKYAAYTIYPRGDWTKCIFTN